ncbi:MAG: GNAT family N-acetyltransferase [bacterium]|nr:GNAT family N-acetyltransferase [bacterium]
MKILATTTPTSHQIAQADKLCTLCCQFDHISLDFPEQASWYGFAVKEDTLFSAMALFEEENGLFSLSAFTLPSMRRQGLFSSLLEEAVSWLETNHPQADLDIIADLSCPAAAHTLSALEAELWYEDFQMCRSIPDKTSVSRASVSAASAHLTPVLPASASPFFLRISQETLKDSPDAYPSAKSSCLLADAVPSDCFYLALCAASDRFHGFDASGISSLTHVPDTIRISGPPYRPDTSDFSPVVWAHLTVTASDTAWLHDVETAKGLRGRGLATQFLHALFSRLTDSPIRTLFLHVTSDNLPAVAVYRKTGFYTVQTLSHFLY